MNPAIVSEPIVEEITIKAPAARIFEALTNPSERIKWWGAEGRFQTKNMESDLRPDGKWMMSGIGVGGKPFRISGVYQRIDRPRMLEFTWLPDFYENATESLVRFDLEEKDGTTTVRVTHSRLTEIGRTSHRGWPQVLGWLQAWVEQNS